MKKCFIRREIFYLRGFVPPEGKLVLLVINTVYHGPQDPPWGTYGYIKGSPPLSLHLSFTPPQSGDISSILDHYLTLTAFASLFSLHSPFTYLFGIYTSHIYIYIYIYRNHLAKETIVSCQARCPPYLTHESLQYPVVLQRSRR